MESKRNRYSVRAFICSIVPIVPVVILALVAPRPWTSRSSDMDGMAEGIIFLLVAPCVAVTMPVGITGVVLAIIAIRKREPRSKTFAVAAIILGILEIVIVTVCLFSVFARGRN